MAATIDDLTEYRMATQKEPTPFETFARKRKTIDNLVNKLSIEHHKAYIAATEEHLKVEDGYSYDKLEQDDDVRKRFAQTMAQFYAKQAKSFYGIEEGKKLTDEQTSLLIDSYAGITEDELLTLIRQHGKDFTEEAFRSVIDELKKKVSSRLVPGATKHVELKHREGILREMNQLDRPITMRDKTGKEKEYWISPESMKVEKLKSLMETYHLNNEHIPVKAHRGELYLVEKKYSEQKKAA
ncbi:hypothetical protein HY640_01475 [Candidatus Woesearchaeota archaeon]|nr:hypothetical protein [Candidatus Woesearchaeota archaeon]